MNSGKSDPTTDSPLGKNAEFDLKRTQISLRALFLCTTYFAVASASSYYWGVGCFVVACGIFLTWLGYRGYGWWLQTHQNRQRALVTAWAMFLTSLVLPAAMIPSCGTTPPKPTYGWVLAMNGVSYSIAMVNELTSNEDPPPQNVSESPLLHLLHAFFLNLPNIMLLVSPWLFYRQMRADRGHCSTLWGCAALSTWTWAVSEGWKMLIGYYLWMAAVHILFLSRPIALRALIAMGIVGALLIGLSWAY